MTAFQKFERNLHYHDCTQIPEKIGGRLMQQLISHYRNCLTHQPMTEDQQDLVTFIYDV